MVIVEEYCQGGTLKEMIGERLDEESVLKYFLQVLLAVEDIHYKGLTVSLRTFTIDHIYLTEKKEIKIGSFYNYHIH